MFKKITSLRDLKIINKKNSFISITKKMFDLIYNEMLGLIMLKTE